MLPINSLKNDTFEYLYSRWLWFFIWLTGALSSTILLKFGELQYLEIVYAFQLVLIICLFVKHRFKVRLYRPIVILSLLYAAFLVAAFILCLVALNNDFYFPEGLSFLQHPVWITIARMVEFTVDAGAMLYLTHIFRHDLRSLIFAVRTFFWTGVASAVYAIVTIPFTLLEIRDLGAYESLGLRLRGFYNEGGSYGTYLLSVIVVGIALYYLGWVRKRHLYYAAIPVTIAILGCRSKATFFSVALIAIINIVMAKGVGRRLALLGFFAIALVVANQILDVRSQLTAYMTGIQQYERLSRFRNSDYNYVIGKVANSFIVPRMVMAHPFAGIGWGNYATVRNDAAYRGASFYVNVPDGLGLGLLGEAAEFGIPLTIFLFFCIMFPYLYLRRTGAPLYLQNLALIQPVVHIFGAQLNLTYPWVATAFALGIGYVHVQSTQRQKQAVISVTARPHAISSSNS